MADGVADELGGLSDAKLAREARAMGLHRLGADVEITRDLLRGAPFGDQTQHLALAGRQRAERLRFVLRTADLIDDLKGALRRAERAAGTGT